MSSSVAIARLSLRSPCSPPRAAVASSGCANSNWLTAPANASLVELDPAGLGRCFSVRRNDLIAVYSAFELSDTIEFVDRQYVSTSDRRESAREVCRYGRAR